MCAFAVGKFPDENDDVAVLPLIWMKDDNICYWPDSDVRKAARKAYPPDEQTWKQCRVIILQKYDSFREAQENLKLAQYTSDLEGRTYSNQNSVPATPPAAPNYQFIPSLLKFEPPKQVVEPNDGIQQVGISEPGTSAVFHTTAMGYQIPEATGGFTTFNLIDSEATGSAVFNALAKIQATQAEHSELFIQILNQLATLTASQAPTDEDGHVRSLDEIFGLPLKDEEGLKSLESFLKDETGLMSLNKFVKCTGGSDVDEAVSLTLKKLLTDDLANTFSLKGKRGKKSLSDYQNFVASVMAVVRKYPSLAALKAIGGLDDKALQSGFQAALKKAADRVLRRNKASGATTAETPDNP